MDVLKRLNNSAVIPVVVLDAAEDAVPTANALLAGNVDVMEITFRTEAAAQAIFQVAQNCPSMLVGAGTVITLEQCKQAVEMGAQFIVSPGLDEEVVRWCVDHEIPVVPGCVTPSEIMKAMKLGLRVLKFFPANVYGGLQAMKALAGPFGGISFVPTGGINAQNIGEYFSAPFIHAVGGSWICPKADVKAKNFQHITQLALEARKAAMGFEITHVGVNGESKEQSMEICKAFSDAFGFAIAQGNSSNFVSPAIEVTNACGLGRFGHLAVRTNKIEPAIAELARLGYSIDMDTAKYKNGKMIAVYLKAEIGGFAVHLLQKS